MLFKLWRTQRLQHSNLDELDRHIQTQKYGGPVDASIGCSQALVAWSNITKTEWTTNGTNKADRFLLCVLRTSLINSASYNLTCEHIPNSEQMPIPEQMPISLINCSGFLKQSIQYKSYSIPGCVTNRTSNGSCVRGTCAWTACALSATSGGSFL